MFELLDFNQRSCKIAQNIELIKIQFLEVKALREFGGYSNLKSEMESEQVNARLERTFRFRSVVGAHHATPELHLRCYVGLIFHGVQRLLRAKCVY